MLDRISIFAAALAFACTAAAQQAEVFADSAGAIRGYDAVAYFTQGQAVKGQEKFTYPWRGATWRFASAENRDRFAASPEQYAPRYGGYCAYAVAQGSTASIDPAAWSIVEGRLFLNYSLGVRERWRQDVPGYIRKADANWPGVLGR